MPFKRNKDRGKYLSSGTPLVVVLLVLSLAMYLYFPRETQVRELQYGSLMQILKEEDPAVRYRNVMVKRGSEIRGELLIQDTLSSSSGSSKSSEVRPFRTAIGLASDVDLLRRLDERAGAHYQGDTDRSPLDVVVQYLMLTVLILAVGITGFMIIRWFAGGNSPFTFGRSRHKLYADSDNKVTFEDVAGIDEAVAELREIVDFLKTPDKYQALGGRIPKGVLLVGPPGTGKTLLARAVAGEADVPFFSLSGSDFVEMFVGVGASRVRDLFDQAESRAPCIVFIDELDALGKTRGGTNMGGHDEREQTLNQLLVEMDGFDSNRGVILMAATNRPETLDPALLRAGRFDRTVVVDRPDINGREAILKVHARSIKMATAVELRHIASLTPGSVGADLANLVNEAALLAARKNKPEVGMEDFNEAVERGAIGLERKSRIMLPEEKLRTAYHEGGHALVACALPNTHPVHKVSIIPRGVGALGYVLQRPDDDRHMQTQGELESKIKICLAGTVAEEIVYREIATGATSDLDHANNIARNMVKVFGMSRLGRVFFRDGSEASFLPGSFLGAERQFSEETAREIDMEVRRIIEESLAEVRSILSDRRAMLDALAKMLMEKEVIDGKELREFLQEYDPSPRLVPGSEQLGPHAAAQASAHAGGPCRGAEQAVE